MARLAAQMNGEYYPTPPEMTKLIARHIALLPNSSTSFLRLYDPCAGEGVALSDLRIYLQEQTELLKQQKEQTRAAPPIDAKKSVRSPYTPHIKHQG